MLDEDVILFIIKYLTLANTGVTAKNKSSKTTVRNIFFNFLIGSHLFLSLPNYFQLKHYNMNMYIVQFTYFCLSNDPNENHCKIDV